MLFKNYKQLDLANTTYFILSNNVQLTRWSDYWDRTNGNNVNKDDFVLNKILYYFSMLGSNKDFKTSYQSVHHISLYKNKIHYCISENKVQNTVQSYA